MAENETVKIASLTRDMNLSKLRETVKDREVVRGSGSLSELTLRTRISYYIAIE